MKFFLLLVPFFALGEVKYPRGLYSPTDMVREFRGALESKLRELPQNFIVKRNTTNAIYFSEKNEKCNNTQTQARDPLAMISYASKIKNGALYEDGKIFGCKKEEIFHESLYAKGANLTQTSFKDYLNGKIKIEPHKYDAFDYQIKLARYEGGMALFRMTSNKVGNKTFFNYYLFEQKFLEITYQKTASKEIFYTTLFPYHFNMSHFRSHFEIEVKTSRIERDASGVRYFSPEGEQIAPSLFALLFNNYVTNITLRSMTNFVKFYISFFPSTELVASGGQNQRILDELRLAYTNILNNIDLNYVKNLLLEFINAIENGLLKVEDNRPDQ